MKLFRIIHTIMSFLLVIGILAFGLMFLFPKIIGYTPYNVATGSMEPTIHIGSLIYVKQVPPEAIFEKSIVTFRVGNSTITHRVVSVNKENQTYITKGDANNVEDGEIAYSQIIGKVEKIVIPYVGELAEWMQEGQKRYSIIVFAVIYLIIWITTDFLGKKKVEKKER